ncbi:mechanosensitive ion channel family protein [Spirosoma montaniterrae]|uniref:Mechanosensitive ion channel protein n=1 Tax=Spirosoma montaniterrae TaxID=1178516 RepID=A0A1P9WST5_9BACT|nr:mechanosensitive ion channel domain-containing protein [Spirosoma montaniterrae]AQG78422.1 mechanosensitive ion channel protein [Spirosoma montaniterrae]
MEKYAEQLQAMAVLYAPRVLLAIITLIVGFWAVNYFVKLLTKVMQRRHVDATVIPFLQSIIEVVLKVVLVISVAGMFGVETTSFVALIGGAGLAIGLALQGSLGHFASGIMLLVFRPYRVGDLVTVAGFTGEVTEIQVFNTVLKTLDNKRIIIPNGAVTSGPITNISGQGTIRVDMQFSVAGSEDIDKVIRVAREVCNASPLILSDPAADILVNSQEIGITKFDVRPWCKSEHYWDVYYYVQENIKRQFVAQDVQAPTPAMNIMMAK